MYNQQQQKGSFTKMKQLRVYKKTCNNVYKYRVILSEYFLHLVCISDICSLNGKLKYAKIFANEEFSNI